jgi:hypothetical protein
MPPISSRIRQGFEDEWPLYGIRSAAVVYINDKRVYITADELNALLTGYSADNIKSVEVSQTRLPTMMQKVQVMININTSKGISLGCKGPINVARNDEFTTTHHQQYRTATIHVTMH